MSFALVRRIPAIPVKAQQGERHPVVCATERYGSATIADALRFRFSHGIVQAGSRLQRHVSFWHIPASDVRLDLRGAHRPKKNPSESSLTDVAPRVCIAVEGETRHDLEHGRPVGRALFHFAYPALGIVGIRSGVKRD